MKYLTDENGMLFQTYFLDAAGNLYEWSGEAWRWVGDPTPEQLAAFEAEQQARPRVAPWRGLALWLERMSYKFGLRKLYVDTAELDADDWDYGDDGVEVRYVPRPGARH